MAKGFGATLGAGTTDRVTSALTAHATQRTWHLIANRRASGGGGFGTLWRKNSGAAAHESFFHNNAGSTYRFDVLWNGVQSGLWTVPQPAADTDVAITLTYDNGSTANVPAIYFDGVAQTVTNGTPAPTGSLFTPAAEGYWVGNRSNDSARNWDGVLSEFAVWDRILAAAEIAALGEGFSPLHFPRGLVEYLPMIRDDISLVRAAPTITGTAVRRHPRLILPSRRRQMFRPTPSAPGSAIVPIVMHHRRQQGAA